MYINQKYREIINIQLNPRAPIVDDIRTCFPFRFDVTSFEETESDIFYSCLVFCFKTIAVMATGNFYDNKRRQFIVHNSTINNNNYNKHFRIQYIHQ